MHQRGKKLQSLCNEWFGLLKHSCCTKLSPSYVTPTAKYSVTNSLWIANCHLISRNFWSSALICLCTCPVFKWVCQTPCTPTSLTVWYTGNNVIRCDPEQYVRTLADGRGYSTGGANSYAWCNVLCVHIMAGFWTISSKDQGPHL